MYFTLKKFWEKSLILFLYLFLLDEQTPLLKSTEKSYYVKEGESSESSVEQQKQKSTAVFSKGNSEDLTESIDDSSVDFKDGNTSSPSKKIRLNRIRTVCLVIALMVHSLFEGLTVGLQQNTTGVLILVALLSFHKCIVGFSLGMALNNDKSDLKSYMKKAVSKRILQILFPNKTNL